jgi:hypothetical protein
LNFPLDDSATKHGQHVTPSDDTHHHVGTLARNYWQASDVVIDHMIGCLSHRAVIVHDARECGGYLFNELSARTRPQKVPAGDNSDQRSLLVQYRETLMRGLRRLLLDPSANIFEAVTSAKGSDRP